MKDQKDKDYDPGRLDRSCTSRENLLRARNYAEHGIRDSPTCSAKPSARGYFVRAKSRHSFCVILFIWLCVDLPESRFTSGSRGGSTIASVRTITRVRIHSRRSIGD